MLNAHLCLPEFMGVPGGMRGLYDRLEMLPTSENADVVLIRSHIAYWAGNTAAARAVIWASRGHTYKVSGVDYRTFVVRVVNPYDHRDGVTGFCGA
jgi:hypothetical protein